MPSGDALRDLAHVLTGEQLAQLRLSDEDHLQQLAGRGLEVGEQPHLFEDIALEQVRLVDQHRDAPPCRVRGEQMRRERVDQRLDAAARGVRHRDPQLFADGEQELGHGDARVEDQRDLHAVRLAREQRTHQRGLAGTHLARELDEAARLADAVDEMRERLGVAGAREEIARVGRDGERRLVQPEERLVHVIGRAARRRRAGAPPAACRRSRGRGPR